MSKYRFSIPQRYAVWKIIGPLYCWCKEPVHYQHCQIDHIIPEDLIDDTEQFQRLITLYGLKEGFNINGFENWAPIHSGCNQSKQDKVFEGAPFVEQLLHRVRDLVSEVEELYKKWLKEPEASKLISQLEKAINSGLISEEDLNNVLLNANAQKAPAESIITETEKHHLLVSPLAQGWKIIREYPDELGVEKNGKYGIIPRPGNYDMSYVCYNCFNLGPWDGNRCQSCGRISSPF